MEMHRRALLHMDGWAGRTVEKVVVIGETPKRYRIQADKPVKLPGKGRWLKPGESALVPKRSVTFREGA